MTPTTQPKEYVKLTQEVLSSKIDIFETFPCCIEKIINEKIWAKVTDKKDEPFKSFEAFCKHPLWHGLELTIDELMTYLKRSPEIRGLVIGELDVQPEPGGNHNPYGCKGKANQNDNINLIQEEPEPKGGTSPTYIAKRLKRDNPELFSKVQSGELTAHAAAIVAGFKKPMVQVRTDNADEAINKLLKHYTLENLKKALSKLI